jgi:hypothetical protein
MAFAEELYILDGGVLPTTGRLVPHAGRNVNPYAEHMKLQYVRDFTDDEFC